MDRFIFLTGYIFAVSDATIRYKRLKILTRGIA